MSSEFRAMVFKFFVFRIFTCANRLNTTMPLAFACCLSLLTFMPAHDPDAIALNYSGSASLIRYEWVGVGTYLPT